MVRKISAIISLVFITVLANGQLVWLNVDSFYQPLPPYLHIFKSVTPMNDGKPSVAFYVEADLKAKGLIFDTDTSSGRRLTPQQFFEKNNRPLVVVNTTFFSFETNKSLNVVVKDGELVAYNTHNFPGRAKDTLTYRHPLASAIGITKKRKADIAWTYVDTTMKFVLAAQQPIPLMKDSSAIAPLTAFKRSVKFKKWNVRTATGGGPVLLQNGEIAITNNEEWRFQGKAIDDKHPRTAMGYTRDHKLIIMVIEGRHPGTAEGATLTQEAQLFKELGCEEAINLDGGGSSCLLINGKETIKVTDPTGQRPVPAVFMIKRK